MVKKVNVVKLILKSMMKNKIVINALIIYFWLPWNKFHTRESVFFER